MTLEDLGNIGSFVGGALVIVSLLYLAFEIRQNAISLKASAYQESIRAANEYSALLAVHPDLNRLLLRSLDDFTSLDPEERSRVSQLFMIALRNFALNLELAEVADPARDLRELRGRLPALPAISRRPGLLSIPTFLERLKGEGGSA